LSTSSSARGRGAGRDTITTARGAFLRTDPASFTHTTSHHRHARRRTGHLEDERRSAARRVIFVDASVAADPSSPLSRDGTSWARAFETIDAALDEVREPRWRAARVRIRPLPH